MSFLSSLKTFIDGRMNTTSYASVESAFGQRPQGSDLQFITYMMLSDRPVCIGSDISLASVTIDFMAENAETALDMAVDFTASLPTSGTYGSVEYQAIIDQHWVMQEPTIGTSDEATIHTCTVSLDIYYERP